MERSYFGRRAKTLKTRFELQRGVPRFEWTDQFGFGSSVQFCASSDQFSQPGVFGTQLKFPSRSGLIVGGGSGRGLEFPWRISKSGLKNQDVRPTSESQTSVDAALDETLGLGDWPTMAGARTCGQRPVLALWARSRGRTTVFQKFVRPWLVPTILAPP